MAILNELVTALSVDIDSKTFKDLSKFQTGITTLQSGLEKLGQIFTGKKTMSEILFGSASEAQNMLNTSERLGLSLKNIQEWSHAAEAVGVTSSSVLADISELQKKYGMSLEDILNLAEQVKRANPLTTKALQQLYGLSDDTVQVFKKGKEEIRGFFAEADKTLISDEEIKKLASLKTHFNEARYSLSQMITKVVSEYAPKLDEMIKKFQKWASEEENVKLALEAIAASIAFLAGAQILGAIGTVIGAVLNIAKAFLLLKNIIFAMSGMTLKFLKTTLALITPIAAGAFAAASGFALWQESSYQKRFAEASWEEKQRLAKERQEQFNMIKTMESVIGFVKDTASQKYDDIKDVFDGTKFDGAIQEIEKDVSKLTNTIDLGRRETRSNFAGQMTTQNQTTNNTTNNNNITIQTNDIAGAIRGVVESGIEGGLAFSPMQ